MGWRVFHRLPPLTEFLGFEEFAFEEHLRHLIERPLVAADKRANGQAEKVCGFGVRVLLQGDAVDEDLLAVGE